MINFRFYPLGRSGSHSLTGGRAVCAVHTHVEVSPAQIDLSRRFHWLLRKHFYDFRRNKNEIFIPVGKNNPWWTTFLIFNQGQSFTTK